MNEPRTLTPHKCPYPYPVKVTNVRRPPRPAKGYYQSEMTARDGANQVVANTRAHFSRPSCSITIVFSCAMRQMTMPKTALATMSANE